MFDFYFITGISGDKGKKQETRQALHLLVRDCYPFIRAQTSTTGGCCQLTAAI